MVAGPYDCCSYFVERARDDMEAMGIVMSGMWLQDPDSLSSGNTKLLIIFVGIVAFSMLVQAIAEEVREKLMPVISGTHEIIRDAGPKVKIITENLVETSHVVRTKAREFDATASELNMKARMQAARVDGMVR